MSQSKLFLCEEKENPKGYEDGSSPRGVEMARGLEKGVLGFGGP